MIKPLIIGKEVKNILELRGYMIEIHSIFENAINLMSNNSDWIITLLPQGYSVGPQTIILDHEDFLSFKNNIKKNDFYNFKDFMDIDDLAVFEQKTLGDLPKKDLTRIKRNITIFNRMLRDNGNSNGLSGRMSAYYVYAKPYLEACERHILKDEYEKAGLQLSHIVGLGPGLTPSGDDFIVGVFAGIHYFGFNEKDKMLFVDCTIKESVKKTNIISYNMLRQSAKGGFIKWVEDMVLALIYGSDLQIQEAFKNMMKIGSSSGSDISSGIIWGIETHYIQRNNLLEEKG